MNRDEERDCGGWVYIGGMRCARWRWGRVRGNMGKGTTRFSQWSRELTLQEIMISVAVTRLGVGLDGFELAAS